MLKYCGTTRAVLNARGLCCAQTGLLGLHPLHRDTLLNARGPLSRANGQAQAAQQHVPSRVRLKLFALVLYIRDVM